MPVQPIGGQALYRLPGQTPGLVRGGNIDLLARNRLHVRNRGAGPGMYSSLYSMSNEVPEGMPNAGREVLIPRVIHQGGRWIIASPQQAWAYYLATGKNLGVFANPHAADLYANRAHNAGARAWQQRGLP